MVQIIEGEGGLGATLGKGLGAGLKEGLPEAAGKFALQKGLDRLKGRSDLTPLELSSQLMRFTTPEQASKLLPLLQQDIARSQAQHGQQRAQGLAPTATQEPDQQFPQGTRQLVEGVEPTASAEGRPRIKQTDEDVDLQINKDQGKGYQPLTKYSGSYKSILSPGSEDILQTPYQPPSQDEINARALQLSKDNPFEFPTPYDEKTQQAARRYYDQQEKEYQSKAATADRQQKLQKDFSQKFDDSLNRKLSADQSLKDIPLPNELLEHFKKTAETWIATGKKTVPEAVKEATNEAVDLAKSYSNLDSMKYNWWSRISRKPEDFIGSMQNMRDKYEKYGLLKEYQKFLKEKFGLSKQATSALARPIKEGSELEKAVNKVKTVGARAYNNPQASVDDLRQSIKEISPSMGDTDSWYSVAFLLSNKGYDLPTTMRTVNQMYENGEIQLTALQLDDLESIPTTNFMNLNDYFFSTFTYRPKKKKKKK